MEVLQTSPLTTWVRRREFRTLCVHSLYFNTPRWELGTRGLAERGVCGSHHICYVNRRSKHPLFLFPVPYNLTYD